MKKHFLFFILSIISNSLFAPIERITDPTFFQQLERCHLDYMQRRNIDSFFLLGNPIRDMQVPEGLMQNFYENTLTGTDSFFVRKFRMGKKKKGKMTMITEQWLQIQTYDDVEKLATIIAPSDTGFAIFVWKAGTEMPDAPTEIEDIEE